ncbi:MAG: NADH-quinone oxidoreductase subunit NuoH [Chloroflexi bacterium]|nr:NADH-quinone oxidoreductase subunit NuoH [Chloroflexota bacterium]
MGDPFTLIADFLRDLLLGFGLDPGLTTAILKFVGAAVTATIALTLTFFTIWLERKLIARFQDRLGPNRVGPYGLFQTVADFAKLLTKEVLVPEGADRSVFMIAPLLVVMSVVGLWAVVPFAPTLFGSDINVGVLYLVSIGSVGTLGIMMAGLSSNNKYALLGAFRTVAMMLSYAVPMILTLLIPTMLAGSMGLTKIVEAQNPVWFVILSPIAAFIFYISSLAEVGRTPFDLMEAESEIVAGFHIEYSGISFGMFFVAEFLHAFTIAVLTVTLFFGGWQGPGAEAFPILGFVYFLIKTAILYFVIIWIRATFPRLRIDTINSISWKILTPLALAAVIFTAIIDKLTPGDGWARVPLHLAGSVILIGLTLIAFRAYARSIRKQSEGSGKSLAQTSEAGS